MIVYLNGGYLPLSEARVSVEDRGFLFGDGVYEVIRVLSGRPFEMKRHLERMRRGLLEIEIRGDVSVFEQVSARLVEMNDLQSSPATVYLQVTRGAALRTHAFPPKETAPTVFAQARFVPRPVREQEEGVGVIFEPDNRWGRCDIKSINLLPNVLASERARRAGEMEAVLVRDGMVLEGSHSSFFAVVGGVVRTAPTSPHILPSITTEVIKEIARSLGIPLRESAVSVEEFPRAEEVFLASTTLDVMPVVRIDGQAVGGGRPGPVTRRLQQAFLARLLE